MTMEITLFIVWTLFCVLTGWVMCHRKWRMYVAEYEDVDAEETAPSVWVIETEDGFDIVWTSEQYQHLLGLLGDKVTDKRLLSLSDNEQYFGDEWMPDFGMTRTRRAFIEQVQQDLLAEFD